MKLGDGLKPQGKVEIFVTRGVPTITPGKQISRGFSPEIEARLPKIYDSAEIDFSKTSVIRTEEIKNIILNKGKDRVINSLTTGFNRAIARMAIGDRGTIPSDQTVPKVPVATMSALYNEVYRDDVDVTVLNIGTATNHEVKFIKTFSALDIPITSFSNQANPIVNEIGLVMCDLLGGNPLPRVPVSAPNAPDADEELFSIRTFKSVPFESANEISITIRYTVFIE